MGHRHVRPIPHGPQRLRGVGRRPSATPMGSTINALALYYRSCLDNLLPRCP
jgi:hypothetical protein